MKGARFGHATWVAGLAVALALPGCGRASTGDASTSEHQVPEPKEILLATNSGYNSARSARSECLGRQVFDAGGAIQWGVRAPGGWNGGLWRFTDDMHGGHDAVHIGNLLIVVMTPAKREALADLMGSRDAVKHNAISRYREIVTVESHRLKGLNELLEDPSKNINGEDLSTYPAAIEKMKASIIDAESAIASIEKQWQPLDLGIPDSQGYTAGPDLYAFVYRDGRVYTFLYPSGEGYPPFEARRQSLLDTLKNFKFRGLYDVPKERGICIPYGFLPDDGTTPFRIEVSMRYADRPGVIYTIGTATVGKENNVDTEPAIFKAAARAAAGVVGGAFNDGVKRTLKTIGPRRVAIGALPAEQGGISLNVADAGKAVLPNYSVYTGYGGWGGSQVLANITVDMRSFTKEQEPTLKSNPPPFEESLARLDALLKSFRLRPTTVPMPELATSIPSTNAPHQSAQ